METERHIAKTQQNLGARDRGRGLGLTPGRVSQWLCNISGPGRRAATQSRHYTMRWCAFATPCTCWITQRTRGLSTPRLHRPRPQQVYCLLRLMSRRSTVQVETLKPALRKVENSYLPNVWVVCDRPIVTKTKSYMGVAFTSKTR